MLDQTTLQLFSRLPREVADPHRRPVYTVKDIETFIQQNENKTDSLFISLYPSNFLIDKLFFDSDYTEFVYEDFVALFEHLVKNNLNPIPIITGLKGNRKEPRFHLYARLTPHIYGLDAKFLLYKAQIKLLSDVFGDFDKVLVDRREKYKTKERYISFDPTATGDIRRIVRIPNTTRASTPKTHCTYLPFDFPSMTKRELLQHCLSKHTYSYPPLEKRLLLTDSFFKFDLPEKQTQNLDTRIVTKTLTKSTRIKEILRPCVFNSINHIHPSYTMRQIATVDLYDIGLDENQIVHLFSELGWEDFNEDVTRKKVEYYCKGYRDGHRPFSCRKLKELGIPKQCCVG